MRLGTLRAVDVVLIALFAVHIPVSLLDFQTVLPPGWFPAFARDAKDSYASSYNDHLVATSPPWFQALTWLELLFQFPFFFAAIWGFTFKEEWIRAPCIAYGASSATAMVPIVTELLLAKNSMGTKLALAAFYGPFALLPVLVLARSIRAPMFSTIRTHQKWN